MQVNVHTFRNTTDHLFKLVNDLKQCVGRFERENTGAIMKRILHEAQEQNVKRAKAHDHSQRAHAVALVEKSIEQAFSEKGHLENEQYSKQLIQSKKHANCLH